MKFILSDSPFRNLSKYGSDNIFDFVLPIVREFCSTQHDTHSTPIPPSAFVFKGDSGNYYNGYEFSSPEDFAAELSLEAPSSSAIITVAEVGSMHSDFSMGLIIVCAQSPSYYRCRAFSLLTDDSYDIFEDPLRIEIPNEEGTTPTIEDDSDDLSKTANTSTCHLMGIEPLLTPLFAL